LPRGPGDNEVRCWALKRNLDKNMKGMGGKKRGRGSRTQARDRRKTRDCYRLEQRKRKGRKRKGKRDAAASEAVSRTKKVLERRGANLKEKGKKQNLYEHR